MLPRHGNNKGRGRAPSQNQGNDQNGQNNNRNYKRQRGQRNNRPTKNVMEVGKAKCYRYEMTSYWAKTCRTDKHCDELYWQKGKTKQVVTNSVEPKTSKHVEANNATKLVVDD